MLYNKNWDAKTVTSDPYKVETLVAWLEKQPADQIYDYCDTSNCLIAQYLKAHGVAEFDVDSPRKSLPQFWDIVNGGKVIDTFGAALKRAHEVAGK